MRRLEQAIRTAPDDVACESALRWTSGLALRGAAPPPLTATIYERFRRTFVLGEPCRAR
jgi:hypothetical protein